MDSRGQFDRKPAFQHMGHRYEKLYKSTERTSFPNDGCLARRLMKLSRELFSSQQRSTVKTPGKTSRGYHGPARESERFMNLYHRTASLKMVDSGIFRLVKRSERREHE